MGQTHTKPPLSPTLPEEERYFGLENFGNTCYCNSVLQTLYFCKPFRERVLEYAVTKLPMAKSGSQDHLLACLAELFSQINSQKRRTGYVSPRKFVSKVKAEDARFSSFMHQDAHEFLNYLLNEITDILAKEVPKRNGRSPSSRSSSPSKRNGSPRKAMPRMPSLQQLQAAAAETAQTPSTWVHELFQGRWVNETRCLCCETLTRTEQTFYELQLDISQNSSVTSCLKHFSNTELLQGNEKFFCDECGCLQEARRRTRLASVPPILCLHLKRFIYLESGRLQKLMHRVVFPFELKLWNTTEDCPHADSQYDLFAVVVHMGAHLNHGHYVALVKSAGQWVLFDDEQVASVSEAQVQTVFGSTNGDALNNGGIPPAGHAYDHGYILLYQRRE